MMTPINIIERYEALVRTFVKGEPVMADLAEVAAIRAEVKAHLRAMEATGSGSFCEWQEFSNVLLLLTRIKRATLRNQRAGSLRVRVIREVPHTITIDVPVTRPWQTKYEATREPERRALSFWSVARNLEKDQMDPPC